MRKLLACVASMVVAASALAQAGRDEQEVRDFLAEYEKAVFGRDVAFLERVLPDDYVYTGASGRLSTRAQALAYFERQKGTPPRGKVSIQHENVKVRVVGNVAIVTNDYVTRTTPLDSPGAEPHVDRGGHTGVLEKRGGRWMVLAEQDTEQPHDDRAMEQEVRKAGREYNELMKRLKSGRSHAQLEESGDLAALDRLLADEYTYTSRDGEISSKAGDLEGYRTNPIRLASADLLEQRVRVIGNNAAVETGKIRYVGTNAGQPFDITKRYTTTWVSDCERWRIVADHTSMVKAGE